MDLNLTIKKGVGAGFLINAGAILTASSTILARLALGKVSLDGPCGLLGINNFTALFGGLYGIDEW